MAGCGILGRMIIYDCPGFLRVVFVEAAQGLRGSREALSAEYFSFEWEDFSISLSEIKKAHAAALDAARARRCFRFVAQCARARDSLLPEVIVWWRKVWVPELIAAGVSRIVTVVPSSTLAALSNRDWQRELQDGLELVNVTSLQDAMKALDPSEGASA
jgi:hypothetical protein